MNFSLPVVNDNLIIPLYSVSLGSESSSDNLTNFTKAVEKINGLSDETDTSIDKPDISPKSEKITPNADSAGVGSSIKATPKTPVSKYSPEKSAFDVNICYDNTELVFFTVERQAINKSVSSSDKSSVCGSVNSVTEPFALPRRSSTLTSNSSTLSSLYSEPVSEQLEKTRKEIKGTVAVCDYIIDHFEKVPIA